MSRLPTSLEKIRSHVKFISRTAYCGVYFLVKDFVVVYVGQSVDIKHRLKYHGVRGDWYDDIVYLPVEEDRLDYVELYWINKLQPKHNDVKYKERCKHPNVFPRSPF